MKPLAIDLFCGLGGWTEGLVAENFDVIGFDIERHVYGDHAYPAQLVLQDVLTLDGAQFKDAGLIVASPPCQFFSYTAMPWTRAKERAERTRNDPDLLEKELALFNACFRIQREACEAAGRHIPMVVENVRGAQPWVGRARWNHGSYYLWGDVPALMPMVRKQPKVGGLDWSKYGEPDYKSSGAAGCFRDSAIKNNGDSRFNIAHNTTSGTGRNPDGRNDPRDAAIKQGGDWFGDSSPGSLRSYASKSTKRKAASAMIAKIPLPLARHIGRVYMTNEHKPAVDSQ